jgi:hypothetical protein
MSQPIDYSLMALRMMLAGERDDGRILLAVSSAGLPASEAEYVVAKTRGRAQELRQQAREALADGKSPFTASEEMAAKTGLPRDLSEQLIASVMTDRFAAWKGKELDKGMRRSKDLADVIAKRLLKLRPQPRRQSPPGG